jgi:tetratricopeptide (TPR) repeat protein
VARPVDHAGVWRNLAALQLYRKQPAAAASIATAIASEPQDLASWVLRARMRLELDGFVDANEALDDAKYVDRQPKVRNAKAKRMLGLAYLRMDRSELAATSARQAIELGDMPTINHLVLAVALASQQERDAAREHLVEGMRLWPAELKQAAFAATSDEGTLWFESADELNRLRAEAEARIDGLGP